MRVSEFAVKQPVATWMIFLALLLLGGFSMTRLNIDMLPHVEPPVITVITTWKGASASDVESELTEVIEDAFSSVNNLDSLNSKSQDSLSLVACKFGWGTDLDTAGNDIRDKLEFVRRYLPKDADPPMLFKFSSATAPVLTFTVTADKSVPRLYHLTDTYIGDALKRVPGVGAVLLYGGLKRRINTYFDKEKIEGFNLSLQKINYALSMENINIPAGSIKTGGMEYFMRVPSRFKSAKDAKDTVVGAWKGNPIYLKDVAEVTDDFEPPEFNAWGDGESGIVVMVQRQAGKNTVEVIERIKSRLEKIKKELPPDVKINIVADNSEDILNSVRNLRNSLLCGIVFVILVTLGFLRRIKSSIIISMMIPFSMIVAFIFMLLNGDTINLISLMALAIVSGMVVDNGIVVLENIITHFDAGSNPYNASIDGASEMWLAITGSTLTTVIVFLPLMFLSGLAGILFKVLGYVLTVTLMASLFTALMIVPLMCSRWLRKPDPEKEIKKTGFTNRLVRMSEEGFRFVDEIYQKTLEWAISNRKLTIATAIVIFISGLSLIPNLSTGFFPKPDTGDISIRFRLPEGTRIEHTDSVVKAIMKEVNSLVKPEEMRHYFATDGKSEDGYAVALGFEQGPNVGQVSFKLVDRDMRERTVDDIAEILRKRVSKIPGISWVQVLAQNKTMSALMGSNNKPLSVEIQSIDSEDGSAYAKKLTDSLSKVQGIVDVSISQKDPRPEIWIEVDRVKAASLGLNSGLIAASLRNYYYGYEATELRDSGERFDIFTRFSQSDKDNIDSIPDIPIFAPDGRMIRLGNVAKLVQGQGPIELERKNRQRIIKIEADIYKITLGNAKSEVKRVVSEIGTPPGVSVSMGGDVEEQKKVFKDLLIFLILGIILVYMVMASLFRNLRDPFIVMFSVPFAFTGIFYAYFLTGTALGVMAFMGVIMLMGIVVNNAIVLIDYIHLLEDRGYETKEAITLGCRSRLRPVLMTTLTTIFGMIPMAVSRGIGAETWNPLGITMLGGLSVSTLVTLVLIPTIYYSLELRKKRSLIS